MFSGYSTYNDIESGKVKAWNRLAAFYNITKDVGQAQARSYMDHFNDIDRSQINKTIKDIKAKGYMAVRKEVMNELV